MAPEQIQGGEADARSDLFAFGAVVFEMVTGTRAFDGDSASSIRAAVVGHDPPRCRPLEPLVPRAMDGHPAPLPGEESTRSVDRHRATFFTR